MGTQYLLNFANYLDKGHYEAKPKQSDEVVANKVKQSYRLPRPPLLIGGLAVTTSTKGEIK